MRKTCNVARATHFDMKGKEPVKLFNTALPRVYDNLVMQCSTGPLDECAVKVGMNNLSVNVEPCQTCENRLQ